MNQAFFDLSGTVVKYGTDEPIPLMPQILNSLHDQGWKITILSSHSDAYCRRACGNLGLIFEPRVISSSGTPKGLIARSLIADFQEDGTECIFIDDKPKNLASVKSVCGNKVRVIGFIGSGKYVPRLSQWCADNHIELALSPPDLCEGLRVQNIDAYGLLINSIGTYSSQDLISLLPGLDHPASSMAGETHYFDHRAVTAELANRNLTAEDYPGLWQKLAWITCNECLWKLLVTFVLKSQSLNSEEILGKAYKHYEYTSALKAYYESHPQDLCRHSFRRAFNQMKQGIETFGIEAERCRINQRHIKSWRIAACEERFEECFVH